MATVLLVIHIMVAAALVGLVLLQRSEGGALGIGGSGGSGGGFMTGRSAANLLTRVTAVFAAMFFATSILLTLIAQQGSGPSGGLESLTVPVDQGQGGGKGNSLEGIQVPTKPPSGPQVPQSQ